MNEHPQTKTLEYNSVADGIYIGTNQCCQTHFDEKLRKDGIEADISLEEERIDAPFGVAFYVWIPIKNHTAPTQDQLDFGVSTLEKLVSLKKKIYVHCQNGHGRAPSIVAAYFIKQGKSPDEAIEFIKVKRPSIHLEDTQREVLVEFSKRINQLNKMLYMKEKFKKLLLFLAPILGTGAIGVCPLCWAASASFLTYIGLGVLIPFWRKIALAFILLGLIGFILDYRKHRNIIPLILLAVGGTTLYVGRYVFVVFPKLHILSGIEGFAGWPIWGLGGLMIIAAVVYNRLLFKKPKQL